MAENVPSGRELSDRLGKLAGSLREFAASDFVKQKLGAQHIAQLTRLVESAAWLAQALNALARWGPAPGPEPADDQADEVPDPKNYYDPSKE